MSTCGIPLLKLAIATLAINLRYVIIIASLHNVLAGGLWQRLVGAQFIVDESWALTMARSPETRSASFLFGSGFVIFVVCNSCGLVGFAVGERIPDPRVLGLDFAPTAAFAALALGMWRRASADLLPWTAAAIGASAAAEWLMAGLHVVSGAAAGLIAVLFLQTPRNSGV